MLPSHLDSANWNPGCLFSGEVNKQRLCSGSCSLSFGATLSHQNAAATLWRGQRACICTPEETNLSFLSHLDLENCV